MCWELPVKGYGKPMGVGDPGVLEGDVLGVAGGELRVRGWAAIDFRFRFT